MGNPRRAKQRQRREGNAIIGILSVSSCPSPETPVKPIANAQRLPEEDQVETELRTKYDFGPEFHVAVNDPFVAVCDGMYLTYWEEKAKMLQERGRSWRNPALCNPKLAFTTIDLHDYQLPVSAEKMWMLYTAHWKIQDNRPMTRK